ncbi:hypothetical protein C6P45_000384 [Maudiozyma exigua]|uniref:Trafficking protein particle complex subunit 11 domain-containing protein n=1 Tax=Maudiozyma exigua TaxID=34358 RepID=A0A9P7BD90_MAUEX|nr:hypothetical protein C6P45_000384 [Kazachstania exigua]
MKTSQDKKVHLTYFDPFDLFESVKNEFSQILPLENIHWKSTNGVTRTITSLPVSLEVEEKSRTDTVNHSIPFIKIIIVSCNSIDEYRAKVRPLLRDWLPEAQQKEIINNGPKGVQLKFGSTPIIFFYSNSAVVDSNLFKSVTIMEKFNKDFPEVEALELKSVYKSLKEKEEFWNKISQKLKLHFLTIFQQRLNYLIGMLQNYTKLTGESRQDARDMLFIKEKLFDLYFKANLMEEGSNELKDIKIDVTGLMDETIPRGVLEIPFTFQISEYDSILMTSLENEKLTYYYMTKYFFIREFFFLNLEVNTKTRILKLYKLTKQFLIDITTYFQDDPNLLMFKYSFLTSVIEYLKEIKIGDNAIKSEVQAEFLLMKRDAWVTGVLNVTDFELLDKGRSEIKYHFTLDEERFGKEDKFYETFISYNTELLSLFRECEGKRQRIADIISLEIGMIYHQRKEYQNAVSLLISCYEYYVESEWTLIGFNILKVFTDSLENCPKLENIESDGSSVSVSTILCNSYLNLIKLSTNVEEKITYWNKFLKLKKQDAYSDITYSMAGLFEIITDPVVSIAGANAYSIKLNINNMGFPVDVHASSIKLTLRESQRQESKIEFELHDVDLKCGCFSYELVTENIKYGQFEVNSLVITIDDTLFLQEYGVDIEDIDHESESISITSQSAQVTTKEAQIIDIFEFYTTENVSISVDQAKILELGENSLELKIENFDKINKETVSLQLQILSNSVSRYFSFSKEKSNIQKKYITDIIEPSFIVPYYLEEQITSFALEVEFSFERIDSTIKKKYVERKCNLIECYLPVSVSVEDIFKNDIFFFKFLLSSSVREEPIILHSSKLSVKDESNSKKYDIIGDYEPEQPIVLLSTTEENCLNCYRLRATDTFDTADIFNLHVSYNTLKEQIDCLITDSILVNGDVEWYKKFYRWKLFWKFNILRQLRYDYDTFSKYNTIRIDNGTEIINKLKRIIFQKVKPEDNEVRCRMISCLDNLLAGVTVSKLDIFEYTQNLTPRGLIVPVNLPEFEQFYRVAFNKGKNDSDFTEVGIPQQYEVTIKNMGAKWGKPNNSETGTQNEYIFEILSNNDWLLQGKKRFVIPNDNYTFPVTLIPLKKGYITLPHVEITNIHGETTRIDQSNEFESVLVL